MPYVVQEQRGLLEEDLTILANEICDLYRTERFCLLAYKYACLRLGMEVLPQKRYATLSAARAVYSDASFELQRRLKIKPKKFASTLDFPIFDEKIGNLAKKIIDISAKSREPHLAWQGLLNYSIITLGLKIADKQKYEMSLSLIAGVLEYLHNHFYEIEMAPYEDEQIIKNGDVF